MRMHIGLPAISALALFAGVCFAQTSSGPSEDRVSRLERRLDELEKKYQAELKTRDEEIARLKAQMPSQAAATTKQDEVEKTKQDVLKDIESREASPLTLRTPASFNPDMAVVGDFRGSVSTDTANPARNRFDVDSVELDLRGGGPAGRRRGGVACFA